MVILDKNERMRKEKYVEVIEDEVAPTMIILGCTHYLQDSATSHTARLCMDCIRANNIVLVEWPGNSPDLNPIENLWAIMKQKLLSMDNRTREKLIDNIKKVWTENSQEMLEKLARSMPKRIQDCLKYNGGSTKY